MQEQPSAMITTVAASKGLEPEDVEVVARLRLIVIQASSLCNLDCKYCYVPARRDRAQMSDEIVSAAANFFYACEYPSKDIDILWHAGEPLAVGLPFFRRAFSLFEHRRGDVRTQHIMQTNATLVTPSWCDFLQENGVHVGVSLDGPAALHDAQRRSWGGRGSHANAMRGVRMLREAGINPSAICVLTRESLSRPDEIYDFFSEHEFLAIAFNMEETEGQHVSRLLTHNGRELSVDAYRFLYRIWERWKTDGYRLDIREFHHLLTCVRLMQRDHQFVRNPDEASPFGIVTIRRDGAVSTYSPELISMASQDYADFIIGNVLLDTPSDVIRGERFRRLYADVSAGQSGCKKDCPYYPMCGARFQSNRYAESGSLRTTETLTCKLHRQVLIDVVLDCLTAESQAAAVSEL